MTIETRPLVRTFRYNSVDLPDPGAQYSTEEVRDLYAATYPEITSAAVEGPEEVDGKLQYTFRRAVGTKGSRCVRELSDGRCSFPECLCGRMTHPHDLTFDELREANRKRLPLFKNRIGEPAHTEPDGSDRSISEWTNAIAGEVGEACNLAKKIQRGDFGVPNTPTYRNAMRELARELADVVTYADIACSRTGHRLGFVTRLKFNEVSERVGCDVKL